MFPLYTFMIYANNDKERREGIHEVRVIVYYVYYQILRCVAKSPSSVVLIEDT